MSLPDAPRRNDTEADLATATSVVSVGANAKIAAAAAKASRPPRFRWLGYVALLLAGAGLATLASRGVATRSLASRSAATSATAVASASAAEVASASDEPSASDTPAPPPTTSADKPRSRGLRPERKTAGTRPSPPLSPSASAKGGQHCDWHNEQGIWVPTNCH